MLEGTLSNLSTGTTAGELDIIVSRWAMQKKDKESIGNHLSVLKKKKNRIEGVFNTHRVQLQCTLHNNALQLHYSQLILVECNAKGRLQPNPERGVGHHQQVHLETKQTK